MISPEQWNAGKFAQADSEQNPWNRGRFNKPKPQDAASASSTTPAPAKQSPLGNIESGLGSKGIPINTGTSLKQLSQRDVELIAEKTARQQLNEFRADLALEDFNTYGPTIRRVNPLGSISAYILGDTLVIGGGGSPDDETTKNFGYLISGFDATVYAGGISTSNGIYWYAGGTVATMSGTAPCLYIALSRASLTISAAWANETAGLEGRGLPHTIDNFIFPLASFTGTASGLTLVRRHHHGDMIHAIAPAGG